MRRIQATDFRTGLPLSAEAFPETLPKHVFGLFPLPSAQAAIAVHGLELPGQAVQIVALLQMAALPGFLREMGGCFVSRLTGPGPTVLGYELLGRLL